MSRGGNTDLWAKPRSWGGKKEVRHWDCSNFSIWKLQNIVFQSAVFFLSETNSSWCQSGPDATRVPRKELGEMLMTLADSEEVTVEELISALPWQFNWFLKLYLVRSSYMDIISSFFVLGEFRDIICFLFGYKFYVVFHTAFVASWLLRLFALCFLWRLSSRLLGLAKNIGLLWFPGSMPPLMCRQTRKTSSRKDTNNVKEDKVQYETTKTRAGMLVQSAANTRSEIQHSICYKRCTNGREAS